MRRNDEPKSEPPSQGNSHPRTMMTKLDAITSRLTAIVGDQETIQKDPEPIQKNTEPVLKEVQSSQTKGAKFNPTKSKSTQPKANLEIAVKQTDQAKVVRDDDDVPEPESKHNSSRLGDISAAVSTLSSEHCNDDDHSLCPNAIMSALDALTNRFGKILEIRSRSPAFNNDVDGNESNEAQKQESPHADGPSKRRRRRENCLVSPDEEMKVDMSHTLSEEGEYLKRISELEAVIAEKREKRKMERQRRRKGMAVRCAKGVSFGEVVIENLPMSFQYFASFPIH